MEAPETEVLLRPRLPRLRSSLILILAVAAAAATTGRALAQAQPLGSIALRWNDCYGDGGVAARNFACNTNSPPAEQLVVSAFPPAAMPQLNGASIVVDILMPSGTIPSWWQFQSGGCRPTSVIAAFTPTATLNTCLDPWQFAAGGGVSYTYPFNSAGAARLRGVGAIPGSTSIPAGSEVFVCNFEILHSKTVGTGSCGGCATGLCVGLSSVTLYQPLGVGDYTLIAPLPSTTSDVAGWQGEYNMTSFMYQFHGGAWQKDFITCTSATEARRPTWGAIKRLYR